MGLRPTDSDEKHAQRRMPGEYGGAPGVFFNRAVKRGKWTGYFMAGNGVSVFRDGFRARVKA